MLHNLLRGLCRNPGGVVLVAGTIGVLAGLKHFISGRAIETGLNRARAGRERLRTSVRLDRFSLRRTHSDLGYTYWVLQGFGRYRGFTLFDTWQEAIDDIQRRTRRPALYEASTSDRVIV